ncbi:hypothetical protein PTKIN_Ptkin17bG0028500 [Pterospermum kingtungense]
MPKVDNATGDCSICMQSFSQSNSEFGDAKKISCSDMIPRPIIGALIESRSFAKKGPGGTLVESRSLAKKGPGRGVPGANFSRGVERYDPTLVSQEIVEWYPTPLQMTFTLDSIHSGLFLAPCSLFPFLDNIHSGPYQAPGSPLPVSPFSAPDSPLPFLDGIHSGPYQAPVSLLSVSLFPQEIGSQREHQ